MIVLPGSLSGMGPLRRSLMTRLERLGTAADSTEVQLLLSLENDQDDAGRRAGGCWVHQALTIHPRSAACPRLVEGAASAEAHDRSGARS
jgi:hypothetical protein